MATYVNTQIQEFHRYAATRLGTYHVQYQDQKPQNQANQIVLGLRTYELANHLGNVLVVISDKKLADDEAHIVSATDYYPFGMTIESRSFSSQTYRFGFNGQERDTEINVNIHHAEFWKYDARTARRWNTDPVLAPFESPYATFRNNPIIMSDPNGDVPWLPIIGASLGFIGSFTDLALSHSDGAMGVLKDLSNLEGKTVAKIGVGIATGLALAYTPSVVTGYAVKILNPIIRKATTIVGNIVGGAIVAMTGNAVDQKFQNGEVKRDKSFYLGGLGGAIGGAIGLASPWLAMRLNPYKHATNYGGARGDAIRGITSAVTGFIEYVGNLMNVVGERISNGSLTPENIQKSLGFSIEPAPFELEEVRLMEVDLFELQEMPKDPVTTETIDSGWQKYYFYGTGDFRYHLFHGWKKEIETKVYFHDKLVDHTKKTLIQYTGERPTD